MSCIPCVTTASRLTLSPLSPCLSTVELGRVERRTLCVTTASRLAFSRSLLSSVSRRF